MTLFGLTLWGGGGGGGGGGGEGGGDLSVLGWAQAGPGPGAAAAYLPVTHVTVEGASLQDCVFSVCCNQSYHIESNSIRVGQTLGLNGLVIVRQWTLEP
jgi:hypothetical protein